MIGEIYHDRKEAGRKLTKALQKFKNNKEVVIMALPRGGVITAKVVAEELNLPLGLLIVRKIGHPYNPEFAIAVVSEHGEIIRDEEEMKSVDQKWFESEVRAQLDEAKRRRETYWGKKKPIDLKDKIVIIVDDGIATGLTMLSAIKEAKIQKPKKIVVAVPVCPRDTAEKIKGEVGELISVLIPEFFAGAVGDYYETFPQITDKEVIHEII